MLVRATKQGYGGKNGQHQLREEGDVFEVEDGAKGSWFEPVEKSDDSGNRGGSNRRGRQSDDALA
ncbi:hypothetical protein [Bordetella genomosp. 1]|uniref:Uncharacterized protein n=1 Tax=Bordetella genomosp. 1 TaxID=1395607 RepID=A0ABX4EW60_9BORD|nr:hypothetical protein [Bordetella genomosp. 1]OZI58711.1 hypothetical protein CAL27_18690 [Bordetella genomosp. 1]